MNLVIVILLINITNALACGFSWVDYAATNGNYFPLIFGIVMWILVDYNLYKVATSDPGFIPQ